MARARSRSASYAVTGRSMLNFTGESAWTARRQFSSTVRSGKRLVIWKVRASPSAARRWAGARVTSRPKSEMAPSDTGSVPEIRLKSVVLPAPFGPMRARRSPARTLSVTPSTAWSPPKRSRDAREGEG